MNKYASPQIDREQQLLLLKIYAYYRIFLSATFAGSYWLTSKPMIGTLKPEIFGYCASAYFIVNAIALTLLLWRKRGFSNIQLVIYIVLDIAAIIIIADATGGVTSGLAILLVVIIAAASILLPSRIATLMAAIASIALLLDTSFLIAKSTLDTDSFLPAGVLGFILFATSFLIQSLSLRMRSAQAQVVRSEKDVTQLQHLNQLIVERMRTGIVIVDKANTVKMMNDAARQLLGIKRWRGSLHPTLQSQLHRWEAAPRFNSPPFRVSETGPELQASFSALADTEDSDVLIFLEDNRRLAQRAQQMKLASLGRLTASIAHEIRNPLSAISHAAQLLGEPGHLDESDLRLCNIINNHSNRMNQIIENILQLSRRNASRPEQFDLNNWLDDFIRDYKSQGHDGDIQLTCDEKRTMVSFDNSQLRQVITNLTSNGLRHSLKKTGKATLILHSRRSSSTELPILEVIDDGPGISASARIHLFEPFFTTEAKGTGLGLFISRELCEANQARLDYTRSQDNRSCFRISFPHPNQRIVDTSHTENAVARS